MKRTTPSRLAGALSSYLLVLGLCPFPGQAHAGEVSVNGAPALGAAPALAPLALPSLSLQSPADLGGTSLSGEALPAGVLPAQVPAAMGESAQALGAQLPMAAILSQPAVPAEAPAPEAKPTASAQIHALAASAVNSQGQAEGGAKAQNAAAAAFDGQASINKDAAPAGIGGGDGGSINGGNGGNGGNFNGGSSGDDGHLGRLYPRVVMILDPLTGPASDKLVSRIEALADQGVRVVFVTPRPDKGENSAEDVLISKLKVRTTKYPVVVVTYNGSRVHVRNSRAENPKPLLDDEPGFAAPTIERFRKINAAVSAKLKVKGQAQEFSLPNEDGAYIYGVDLPKNADVNVWLSEYNRSMREGGLKYKFEAGQRADGRPYLFTQSTALRLNTGRIFKAVEAQYPELKENLKPSEVLILGDPRKTTRFLGSLKGAGYLIHGVTDGQSLETALGAVLGHEALEKVSVIRSQLRSYAEWLDAREKYGSAPRTGGGGGGRVMPAGLSRYYRDLGFYRGIIMYDLMGRLYHSIRKGQYHEASPEAAQDLLERMWKYPLANGVRISPEMEAARHTKRWQQLNKGYLDTAKQWLRNYYYRNFKDYPHNVSEQVVGTMINLARDSKNSVTVEYASPYTGRRYMVRVLPARMNIERDDKGWVLVADVYRTGKEPYQSEFEDSVETSLVARAALAGYADFHDGKWWVNDESDPRVEVRFHYMTRDLSVVQTPEQIEAKSAEVTSLIEKMLADTEFLAHWEAQEAQNAKVASGAQKAADKRASRRAEKVRLNKTRAARGKKGQGK